MNGMHDARHYTSGGLSQTVCNQPVHNMDLGNFCPSTYCFGFLHARPVCATVLMQSSILNAESLTPVL